jgi:hypothetical protein
MVLTWPHICTQTSNLAPECAKWCRFERILAPFLHEGISANPVFAPQITTWKKYFINFHKITKKPLALKKDYE